MKLLVLKVKWLIWKLENKRGKEQKLYGQIKFVNLLNMIVMRKINSIPDAGSKNKDFNS